MHVNARIIIILLAKKINKNIFLTLSFHNLDNINNLSSFYNYLVFNF